MAEFQVFMFGRGDHPVEAEDIREASRVVKSWGEHEGYLIIPKRLEHEFRHG